MVKTKTAYYDTWKHLRTKMEDVLKTHNFDTKCKTELEKSFIQYLQQKYENTNYDIDAIDIISERTEFEKRN